MQAKMFGPSNPQWKGDRAGKSAGRYRARARFPLGPCELCGRPGTDRHHRDENPLNNADANIQILCRSCHMRVDGRTSRLVEASAATQKARPHCKRGHPRTPENTYARPSNPERRECAVCRGLAKRRSHPGPDGLNDRATDVRPVAGLAT